MFVESCHVDRFKNFQPVHVRAGPGSDSCSIGLDDFVLMRVIGRGSYAKVFVVEQKKTKRIYAMKVIKKELVNDDEVSGEKVLFFIVVSTREYSKHPST